MSADNTSPTEVVSHIGSLPIELLAEIFDLTISDETHIFDVFRISQVCAFWRRVAHDAPTLRPCGSQDWGPCAREAWSPNSCIWDTVLEIAPRLRSVQSSAYKDRIPLSVPLFERLARDKPILDSLETVYVRAAATDPILPRNTLPRLRNLSIV
ncbi:hypothetical protein R3P38DRAFT_3217195 [Favolaschia claudopus]|uniref:F-box domain-containing protein n=1 Tax=Favolaschia claudopus TaxID=2862362 RepID=A0AAW0A605_9AGAR